MCERPVVQAVLVGAYLIVMSSAAHAQSDARAAAAERIAVERARIDSLLPLLDEARAAEEQRRELRRRAALTTEAKLDTVTAGPLLVAGRGRILDRAARLLRSAWQEHEPLLGSAAAEMRGVTFLVQRDEYPDSSPVENELSQRPKHYVIHLPSAIMRGDHPRVVRRIFSESLKPLLPPAVRVWVGREDVADEAAHARVYRALIVRAPLGADRCLHGDVSSCAMLLGLDESGSWAADLTLAQLQGVTRNRTFESPDRARCLYEHSREACVAHLTRMSGPEPLLPGARGSFLHYLLRRAGPGSIQRLSEDSTATTRAALLRVSGGALDSAIAGWQQAVVRARPRAYADLGRSLLVTLLWCGVLVTLAMRSTRWRTT